MAKRLPYSISPDDPDIVLFKEKYPDLFESILDVKFDSLPGKEEDTWNSLNELTGETFGKYIDHCIEHYEFLLGRWSQPNRDKIANFMLTLKDADFGGNDTIKNFFLRIDELCSMPSDPAKTMKAFGFSFAQETPIPSKDFNLWVTELFNTFVKIANECKLADSFNKFIDTGSQALVKKHHFLASQAAFLAGVSYQHEKNTAGSGIYFLPLIFKMLQQAIIWQQEDKVELENEEEPEQKRRKLYSPDSFQFKQVSAGQNSQLFRSLTRDFFIKAWLFRLIESSSTGKSLSKQELLNAMSKRIPECETMPIKTLEREFR